MVTLTFSGGAALRLEVECLEAELADLGPAWATECRPADGGEPPQIRAKDRPNRVDAPATAAPLTDATRAIPRRARAMPIRLDTRSADFSARFAAFLATKREAAGGRRAGRARHHRRRARDGDRALIELSAKFDRVDLDRVGLRVSAAEIEAARGACAAKALERSRWRATASRRITTGRMPTDDRYTDALGVELG